MLAAVKLCVQVMTRLDRRYELGQLGHEVLDSLSSVSEPFKQSSSKLLGEVSMLFVMGQRLGGVTFSRPPKNRYGPSPMLNRGTTDLETAKRAMVWAFGQFTMFTERFAGTTNPMMLEALTELTGLYEEMMWGVSEVITMDGEAGFYS